MFDKIRGEFVDIVEWLDDSRDTIVWRFPRYENEIKMGARLVVRESQVAVFVNEGQIADIFPPGTYTLETQNLPILSTLKGWKHGFHSPFKAEVYFVGTRQFSDFKWGTQNPVMIRDAEFGPIRLRAFGAYSARVIDARKLLTELAGTDQQFRTEEVEGYLRQMIVSRLAPALATAGMPVLDLAAKQHEMGRRLAEALSADLAGVGISIPNFSIENISLPPEVEQALDKRTQMGIVGDLERYAQFQAANAVEAAAENPNGAMGLGVGMVAGQQAAASAFAPPTAPPPAAQPPAVPPPLPSAQWYVGVGGERKGPYDQEALSGLTPETLVWKAGMAQWSPARDVPELAGLLAQTPPPLPPA
ncbi:SPFH domain-containing protein [Nonomuraea sp. NPDC055795]